jgi:polyvinyl alcohol dehydrogenase (cytochrome)
MFVEFIMFVQFRSMTTGAFGFLLLLLVAMGRPLAAQDGEALYDTHCAICHEAGGESPAPGRDTLRQMSPEQILGALERGVMRAQGGERSRAERRVLAEHLSGKPFGREPVNPISRSAFCAGSSGTSTGVPGGTPGGTPGSAAGTFEIALAGPGWNGWGYTPTNTRFQPRNVARLFPADVPRLQLKWAFAFPGASSAGLQPVIVGGRVYVGSWEGDVYSLDARTGCIHWTLETESGVSGAITLGGSANGTMTAYFGDLAANVYAVDAATGKVQWKVKVDEYPLARIRGAVTLHDGRLFVPVSSREESQVSNPRYPCCRFRGSMVSLDAASGRQLWKTYTIDQEPRPTQKNRAGTQLYGPSGIAIWVAPTIDAKRNVFYVGTGNNYSIPATNLSDAIVAYDLDSGRVRWSRQMTENDIWSAGCRTREIDPAICPDADAPDYDFVSSPILVESPGGQDILIAAQKSGIVYALNPDREGETIWQQRVGQGGIMFGPAADGRTLYVAISDFTRTSEASREPDPNVGGGMAALELRTGRILWRTPAPGCGDRRPCSPAQGAAVTAIPGVAFSGSVDGHLRAYAARDGKILWDYDAVREFTTVNGVMGKGGSFYSGGQAVVNGMVFATSGYSHHGGVIPGNVLLAFGVE